METSQAPLNSGFGPTTTADDVIAGLDLTGRCAIVTGGYAGIGLETTRVLADAGASVLVPARDLTKARAALGAMPGVSIRGLDLMDPVSIRDFSAEFLETGVPLDLLINNAGIMAPPLNRDDRGYESQFSTNHLGHFQLTAHLWPALLRSEAARVVTLSSRGHWRSPVDFEDWNFERRAYDPWLGYGQSKTANVLFTVALDAVGRDEGVRAFAVHPGGIITNLSRYMSREELIAAGALDANGNPIIDPARNMKSVQQGAATTIWCATSHQLAGMGGVYCADCDISPVVDEGSANRNGVRDYAIDLNLAQRLWTLSETLTGAKLPASRE